MASTTCPICGLTYVATLPEDRAEHRKRHNQVVRILNPRPSKRFLKLIASGADAAVHVNVLSPGWLQQELYLRAVRFQRDFKYDFPQWSPYGDEEPDAHGFLFNDDTGTFGNGAIAGACVFRWREIKDAPAGWVMDWVWIAPAARRKGILQRRWAAFESRFGKFYLHPPLSDAMKAFASKNGYDPAKIMAAAQARHRDSSVP